VSPLRSPDTRRRLAQRSDRRRADIGAARPGARGGGRPARGRSPFAPRRV